MAATPRVDTDLVGDGDAQGNEQRAGTNIRNDHGEYAAQHGQND